MIGREASRLETPSLGFSKVKHSSGYLKISQVSLRQVNQGLALNLVSLHKNFFTAFSTKKINHIFCQFHFSLITILETISVTGGLYHKNFYGRNLWISVICQCLSGSWPHSQTLDQAGKARQGQTLQLLRKSVYYGRKKFYSTRPRISKLYNLQPSPQILDQACHIQVSCLCLTVGWRYVS